MLFNPISTTDNPIQKNLEILFSHYRINKDCVDNVTMQSIAIIEMCVIKSKRKLLVINMILILLVGIGSLNYCVIY